MPHFSKPPSEAPFGREHQKISLLEDDVQLFRTYQTLPDPRKLRYNFDSKDCWLHLTELWIFADKVCSSGLKKKSVDSLFKTFTKRIIVPSADPKNRTLCLRAYTKGSAIKSHLCRDVLDKLLWRKTWHYTLINFVLLW